MNKGFTLIEVLVSMVILSIITLISSNIINSSLETQKNSSVKLENARKIDFSSIIISRDVRQLINVPLLNFRGDSMNTNFFANNIEKRIMFNALAFSLSSELSPIKRIEYIYENNQLKRKQFFAANPYNPDDYVETILLENISEIDFKFSYETQWFTKWPLSPITSKKIPTLIKINFKQNNKNYEWIIEPNITNVFQY
tara:strand:- start:5589 stop:6182 length:594 start_codon:yes stop_codon:yes gene_type:complete